MRREAKRRTTLADEHALPAQRLDEVSSETLRNARAEHMWAALRLRWQHEAERLQPRLDPGADLAEAPCDLGNAPGAELLECGDRARQYGGARLTHVEAACARHIDVAVVDQRREVLGVVAHQPCLLERPSVAPLRSDVHQAEP